MIAHGSAFPVAKLALNNTVPPILMASLRMGIVLLLLIPFWKFRIPEKKYFKFRWQVEKFLEDGPLKNCWLTTVVSQPIPMGSST